MEPEYDEYVKKLLARPPAEYQMRRMSFKALRELQHLLLSSIVDIFLVNYPNRELRLDITTKDIAEAKRLDKIYQDTVIAYDKKVFLHWRKKKQLAVKRARQKDFLKQHNML